ncbi:MAG: YggS family pyridoxal phosphate-dependent enzyme [Acidobacteriota bacterium]
MNSTAQPQEEFKRRLQGVRALIAAAVARANRNPDEVTLVAVSKTHPSEVIISAIATGLTDFGENRVQEAEKKIPQVGRESARWHLIGHLQSNKARRAVDLFDVIHSIDSAALARRLDWMCSEANRPDLPVLIQVDLAHEPTKSGATEDQLAGIVEAVNRAAALRLVGLMTVPPFFEEVERVRPYFRKLRELRDDLRSQGAFGDSPGELSMGMTHDYEVAIEEGATILRIGTAIFGERN